jgi:hypothetical protein
VIKQLLLTLALAAYPAATAAQHAPADITPVRRDPGVTVTVAGHLLASPRGVLMFPVPLLERLSADGALLSVDTAPVDGRIVVQVRFEFAELEEFRRWYADERTVRLMEELRAITMGGSFETFISYRRAPAR